MKLSIKDKLVLMFVRLCESINQKDFQDKYIDKLYDKSILDLYGKCDGPDTARMNFSVSPVYHGQIDKFIRMFEHVMDSEHIVLIKNHRCVKCGSSFRKIEETPKPYYICNNSECKNIIAVQMQFGEVLLADKTPEDFIRILAKEAEEEQILGYAVDSPEDTIPGAAAQ